MGSHSRPLRLGFAGTPVFAAKILQALIDAGRRPVVVYTQPDRPSGRGRRLQPSPVKLIAEAESIPLEQPGSLKDPAAAALLASYQLDVLVVAAYGLILPGDVLETPEKGCINVHASLLPRWRGAAPIERAIMAGDEESGISIMKMDKGLDTGPVYATRSCPIKRDTDAAALEQALAELGSVALLDCLEHLGQSQPEPQSECGATYASKLNRSDAAIRWQGTALNIERQVRALNDRMPAFAASGQAQVRILKAKAEPAVSTQPSAPGTIIAADKSGICVACGEGILRITQLRLNLGKGQALSAADALNGYPQLLSAGRVLNDG
jgi:methionyl-tRNA formyltransferase